MTIATVQSEQEQRVLLRNIDWETYERLLDRREENPVPRYAYDRGSLEILSALLPPHEQLRLSVEALMTILIEELDLDITRFGSTTLKREDIAAGAEPDASFYIRHAERMRGKERLDLAVDPPPEVAVEIDISHSTLDKLPVYARFGVPEVWRYVAGRWEIWVLEGDRYRISTPSAALPILTVDVLEMLLAERKVFGSAQWHRRIRA